eukprot:Colp12_sorted_trinity150504_noHs@20016
MWYALVISSPPRFDQDFASPNLSSKRSFTALSSAVSYAVMQSTFHLADGMAEMAAGMATYMIVMFALERKVGAWVLLPAIGYSFAWVGHFFFEGNKPATFTYAAYSLWGDYRMFAEVIQGKISIF